MIFHGKVSSPKKQMILAAICGVAAAVLIALYISDIQAQASTSRSTALAAYGGERVEVLVANRDIVAGETLDSGNASMQSWLADLLPTGAFTTAEEAYGLQLNMPILKNEPLVAAKVGQPGNHITVPDGLCALSVPADDVSAVGGAILPGSTVDVYAVGEAAVQLVAKDVLVLESSNGNGTAANSNDSKSSNSSVFGNSSSRAALKWVTLAVDPSKVAELLSVAGNKNLSLVLPGGDSK